jgi:ElaB/YqjD/DUF883 family membrane-anchored ribosome-binding protein
MNLSNEEKRQIMNELAGGKPGLLHQEASGNPSQKDQDIDEQKYENFEDFAQRPVQDVNLQYTTDGNLVVEIREQIKAELQQAKAAGQLRSERIREIVQTAISQAKSQITTEVKAGSNDIRTIVKDTVSSVSESLQEKGSEIKEEVTAAIEGVIEGFSSRRRQSIAKNQAEVKQLQVKIDTEEDELQTEIDRLLIDVEQAGQESSPKVKESIESAIHAFKNSEEFALLKKRYAQLQAQAAILRANLAARYGGRYEEIKENLEEATHWYDRTRTKAETIDQAQQKRSQLEERLRTAREALAKKEKQIRNILSELLQVAAEVVREKEPPAK